MPTVLIVDDDARCREPVARMLRNDGYDVVRVANGKEALDALVDQKIDLILLDQLMPEMDGIEFLQKLRENENFSNLPVIMVSGLNDDSTMDRAQDLGVKDFLVKSRFSITDLRDQIKWHLGLGKAGEPAGGPVSYA